MAIKVLDCWEVTRYEKSLHQPREWVGALLMWAPWDRISRWGLVIIPSQPGWLMALSAPSMAVLASSWAWKSSLFQEQACPGVGRAGSSLVVWMWIFEGWVVPSRNLDLEGSKWGIPWTPSWTVKLCALGSDCWTLKFDFFQCSLAQRDKKTPTLDCYFSPVCAQIVFKWNISCDVTNTRPASFVTVPAPIPASGQAGHST